MDISAEDHLAEAGTPADSGVRYRTVNSVAGLTYRAAPNLALYGSYGSGFETPTLDELAYRSSNGSLPGLNFALHTARSDNYELGLKSGSARMRATPAGFYIRTEDELGVRSNTGGRSVYQHVPATQRRGAEADFQSDWSHGFSSQLGLSYIQALTLQSYSTCIVVPCVPVVVSPGHRIPAVPADTLYAGVTWRRVRGVLGHARDHRPRPDLCHDLNSQAASGYWLANLRIGTEQQLTAWRFRGAAVRQPEQSPLRRIGNRQ